MIRAIGVAFRLAFVSGCCVIDAFTYEPTFEVREGSEKDVDDLAAHFEGGIYGEDENGNWIVGYGVSGSANIVVTPDHVEFGSVRSEPFSPEAKAAIAELRKTLANC